MKSKDSEISAEAQAIISAVESAKNDVKEDIATYREVDPAEALKLIQLYLKTWPDDTEAAEYKAAMPELKKASQGREGKSEGKGEIIGGTVVSCHPPKIVGWADARRFCIICA